MDGWLEGQEDGWMDGWGDRSGVGRMGLGKGRVEVARLVYGKQTGRKT